MNTPAYRSFQEQGAHYFNRQHIGVPPAPLSLPSAWKGAELQKHPDTWMYELNQADLEEIQNAVLLVSQDSLALEEVTRDSFPLPTLGKKVEAWRQTIITGTGVQVVKGLPVGQWSEAEIALAYWGIGHHLGTPGAQNPDNELLGHVKDYDEARDDPFVRLYRTNSNIRYHCDAADIVGLLCLKPAKTGGKSRVVSTVSLFNALYQRHPEWIPRLFEPIKLDRRGELKEGQKPYSFITPCCFDGEQLRTFYHSDYYHSVERHDGIDLTTEEAGILSFYDELGLNPEYYLEMDLQVGDMQFISNHVIAHARTEYIDFDEREKKRHLLRLWLSAN